MLYLMKKELFVDKMTFKQIIVLIVIFMLFPLAVMLFLLAVVPGGPEVTDRVCLDGKSCSTYTVSVDNAEISTEDLKSLAEEIIRGVSK